MLFLEGDFCELSMCEEDYWDVFFASFFKRCEAMIAVGDDESVVV